MKFFFVFWIVRKSTSGKKEICRLLGRDFAQIFHLMFLFTFAKTFCARYIVTQLHKVATMKCIFGKNVQLEVFKSKRDS